MISNSSLNYPDNSDDSGVRKREMTEDSILEKKENFQRLVLDLEMAPKFGPLFKLASFTNKNDKGGILRSTIDDLQKFEESYLGESNAVNSDDKGEVLRKINANFDKEDALENFRKIFVRTMEKIVVNWPTLAANYQWQEIAGFMSGHFLEMAKLMGFEKIFQGYMDNWFIRYAQAEKGYSNRDKLNKEALGVEKELAYYQTTGASQDVIKTTRAKLEKINKQLEELPVDPNAAPAFSRLNPNHKVNIDSPYLKKNGKTIGQKSVQEEKPMVQKPSGLRGFLKKIPLLGRLF